MILDPPKPRRRVVGRILWPIVITVLAVVAVVVASAGDETRADLDYLELVHEQATALSVGGDSLRDVVSRLTTIERTELVTVVDSIRADISEGKELTAEEVPSSELIAVNALYRQALEAWERGVSGFASGLLQAADNPSNSTVTDLVANSLAEMRSGDHLYATMVEEMEREEVPEPVAPMPFVMIMPTEGELFDLARLYVAAARSPNNEIALRPGLAVSSVIPQPEWTVDPEGQVVVPSTESIIFSVVITNSGNVVSIEELLSLSVDGGAEPFAQELPVLPLQPGQQTTVVFDPVPVQAGGVYRVIATLIVSGNDQDFDDNEITIDFTVNEG